MKTLIKENPIITGMIAGIILAILLIKIFGKKSSYSNYRTGEHAPVTGENVCGTGCKRKFKSDVSGKEKWCKGTWKIKLKNGEPRAYCDCVPAGK